MVVAAKLKLHTEGTRLRIRIPTSGSATDTDGWFAILGDLGKGQARLEIWLDSFSGYPERKFYAGLYHPVTQKIAAVTKRVAQELWPIRSMGAHDITKDSYWHFTKRLRRSELNAPILEIYPKKHTYYGIYDPTRTTSARLNSHFCNRAFALFEDVARALPHAAAQDERREVYPQYENRKRVISHLKRDRSLYLATECKIRDNYKCQVCGLVFEERYGKLGEEFAEAHHCVPLGKLRENVKTRLEDLAIVCANCHRMLHKMDGKREDVTKLRGIVRKRRAAAPRRRT